MTDSLYKKKYLKYITLKNLNGGGAGSELFGPTFRYILGIPQKPKNDNNDSQNDDSQTNNNNLQPDNPQNNNGNQPNNDSHINNKTIGKQKNGKRYI